MNISVRDVTVRDEARWRELWAAYVAFYEADVPAHVTDFTWARLMDSRAPVFALVADVDGEVAGFINGVLHENTWADRPVCYLEDLFVDPAHRRKGVARALIEALIERAIAAPWHRIYWRTAASNSDARALYDRLAECTDWVTYEVNLHPLP